jgi:hypothetical protein
MKIPVLLAGMVLHLFAAAQDTHYWTHQFGTRSALMGGAVVSGTSDNSMIFYNPAAVSFIDSISFSINANIYQVENTRIKNVLTDANDFKSFQLTSVPLLSSGQFKIKREHLRLSYGIFSPVAYQFRGLARIEGRYPVVTETESPGNEVYIADENLFSRLREVVIALGASYRFNEQWAVGLTNLIDVRSHNYNHATFTRYYLNDAAQTGVSTSLTQSFNYFNVRYMPKLGLAFRSPVWSWGATVTAPGIRLLGTGSVGVDILADNIKSEAAGRSTVVANSRQRKLKSHFKSPFSAAFGLQYQQRRSLVAISAQYFGRQGVYAILKGVEAPYVRPASAYSLINGDDLISVKTAARPVFNVAIGIEQQLNENLSLNASIRNNQSYYDGQLIRENGIKPDITTWDIYHLVGGVTMRRERSSMSLGLAFGYGVDKNRDDPNLPQPAENNYFKNPVTRTEASYKSFGILLGYNYFFKKG